jgi:hypothetical protein
VGVYVFTHLPTGGMYVGSSNSLGRRLNQYFDKTKAWVNRKEAGLLLPLIKKDGFSAFTLKIYLMPPEFSSKFYYLFLEQYFLLDPNFTLNTQRIVNFRVKQNLPIYLYNSDFTILYHEASYLNGLRREIGIHQTTFKYFLNSSDLYLDFFRITTELQIGATRTNFTLQ